MNEHYSRRKFLALTGVAGGVALAGCSSGSGTSDGNDSDTTTTPTESSEGGNNGSGSWTETSTVEMTDSLKFEPKQIQVSTGTTVTWKNVGAVAHSVTAYENEIPDGAAYFASGEFDSEQAAVDGYPDERVS